MHYYKRNIGDYHKKAGRLTMLEHGAYTLLIDACYDREQFPTLDEAIDWAWARSDAEVDAVKFVLSKFFTLIDGRYVQNRVQEEVEDYKSKADTNSRIAQEREARRRAAKGQSTAGDSFDNEQARTVHDTLPIVDDSHLFEHEPPPNHKPLTINQEPLTNLNKKNNASESFEKPVAQQPEPAYAKIDTAGSYQSYAAFKMHADWKPEPRLWAENLKMAARKVKPEQFTDETLAEFVFQNANGQDKTEQKWQVYYINAIANGFLTKPVVQQTAARGVAQQPGQKEYKDPAHKYFEPLTEAEKRPTSPEIFAKLRALLKDGESEE